MPRRFLFSSLVLLVVASISTACVDFTGEGRRSVREAVFEGDTEKVADLLAQYPGARGGESGVLVMGAAACDSEMARFLLDEGGFDARLVSPSGFSVIYVTTYADADEQGWSFWSGCPEDEVYESLELYLAAGADPCIAPNDRPDLVPAEHAGTWTGSERIGELLAGAQPC